MATGIARSGFDIDLSQGKEREEHWERVLRGPAVLKRGIHGVYHQVSKKHLGRYVDEFTFRLNEGNVKRHSLERLASFVDAVAGKRITYAEVIA